MKRYNNLFKEIIKFDNLLLAAHKAQKGKRKQNNVSGFNFFKEQNLLHLKSELKNKTYKPGKYKTFNIYEPKLRMISAAPYRDRVVHHALCNIIEPVFEKTFIYDSYANRKGKGTHKAILRYQRFMQKNKYVLKADIKQYFPSIVHQILKQEIRKKIKCKDTLWLIDLIIDNSNAQKEINEYFHGDNLFTPFEKRKGLPIGNLTSQFFANIYLNPLDHFVKEDLRCKYYIRYVDDFVIFDNNKNHLHKINLQVQQFLDNYRLRLHINKTKVFPVNIGICFLGHRIFNNFRLLKKDNVKRFKKRLKKQICLLKAGKLEQAKFEQSIKSWGAHAAFSNTYFFKKKIINTLASQGINFN